jgi:hypothetical protein
MIITSTTPSPQALAMLKALQDAVTKNLDQKQKLGQYMVTWENGHPVTKGADAPVRQS